MLKRGSPVQHPSFCCRIPAKFLWEGIAHEWNWPWPRILRRSDFRAWRLRALGRTVWTGGLGKYGQFSFFHGEHKGTRGVTGQDANNSNRRPRSGWMHRRLFQNDMQIRFVGLLV